MPGKRTPAPAGNKLQASKNARGLWQVNLPDFSFQMNPSDGSVSIELGGNMGGSLKNITCSALIREGIDGARKQTPLKLASHTIEEQPKDRTEPTVMTRSFSDAIGDGLELLWAADIRSEDRKTARASDASSGREHFKCSWMFKFYEDQPFLTIALMLENHSNRKVAVDELTPLCIDSDSEGALELGKGPAHWAFFRDGYQSWSPAHTIRTDEVFKESWSTLARSINSNLATTQPGRRGEFAGEWMGAVSCRVTGTTIAYGFLTMKEFFTRIEFAAPEGKRFSRLAATNQADGVILAPGEQITSEPVLVGFNSQPIRALEGYARLVAQAMHARVPDHIPIVWCSWYYFYTKITEEGMLANLETLAKYRDELGIAIEIVQLDDGYQPVVGDWFVQNEKFPHGLKWLAAKIREHGFKPGLWLAPFLVTSASKLYKEHPDWLLRDENGKKVKAGWNPMWPGKVYAVDITHPEVLEWMHKLFTTITKDWGFEYLKLDFLYGGCIAPTFKNPLPRGRAFRNAMQCIRRAIGEDTMIEGCGAPVGPMIGIADTMRIACDTAPHWTSPGLKFLREEGGPTLKHSMRNGLTRYWMHQQYWVNHQDCLLVRDTDTKLTEAEVQSMVSVVGLLGIMVVLSDDMPNLSPHRQDYIKKVVPLYGASAHPRDLFERKMPAQLVLDVNPTGGFETWRVIGLFNWRDRACELALSLAEVGLGNGKYHVFDFWEQTYKGVFERSKVVRFQSVPAHGVKLIGVRAVKPHPWVLATDLHFTMGGVEIGSCDYNREDRTLKVSLEKRGPQNTTIHLSLPDGWKVKEVSTTDPSIKIKHETVATPAPYSKLQIEFIDRVDFTIPFE